MGYCYKIGRGVERDYKIAAYLFTKSAQQGYSYSQYMLGICYEIGQGVEKNLRIAYEWYLKAARQGNAYAQEKVDEYQRKGRFD